MLWGVFGKVTLVFFLTLVSPCIRRLFPAVRAPPDTANKSCLEILEKVLCWYFFCGTGVDPAQVRAPWGSDAYQALCRMSTKARLFCAKLGVNLLLGARGGPSLSLVQNGGVVGSAPDAGVGRRQLQGSLGS